MEFEIDYSAPEQKNKSVIEKKSSNEKRQYNEALEQYIYEDNEVVYNFHKEWINDEIK